MGVALLALMISLGGASYAAMQLPRNSVKSKTIKDGQVKSADVADNDLSGTDINEGSLALPTQVKKLNYSPGVGVGDGGTPLATVGPWTVSGECEHTQNPAEYRTLLKATNLGSPTVVSGFTIIKLGSADKDVVRSQNGNPILVEVFTSGGADRSAGTLFLENDGALAQIDFDVFAGGSGCRVNGTATLAR